MNYKRADEIFLVAFFRRLFEVFDSERLPPLEILEGDLPSSKDDWSYLLMFTGRMRELI